jgi:hypothetical protein
MSIMALKLTAKSIPIVLKMAHFTSHLFSSVYKRQQLRQTDSEMVNFREPQLGMICDIGIGSVNVFSNTIVCNGAVQSAATTIFVTGNPTGNFVKIENADLTVVFVDVNVIATAAVTISASSVRLVEERTNLIGSTDTSNARWTRTLRFWRWWL